MLVSVSLAGLRGAIDFYNRYPQRYRALVIKTDSLDGGVFPLVAFSRDAVPAGSCVFFSCPGCTDCLKCKPGDPACNRSKISLEDVMLALYSVLADLGYEMRIV